MNSSYGKTCLKPSESKIKVIKNKDLEDYIYNHGNNVIKTLSYKNQTFVYKTQNKLNHFNRCHVGSLILSMSKRIMSEVMTLADDKIYYQDTDSMHITKKNIEILENLYKQKYNRELIGEYMG